MEEKQFQDVFRQLRIEIGKSQESIAKELDVSQSLINNWETGRSTPAPEMLQYIADYFDLSIDYLVGRTNDKRWYPPQKQEMKVINEIVEELSNLSLNDQHFILTIVKNFQTHYIKKESEE